jgi:hypothetical protein
MLRSLITLCLAVWYWPLCGLLQPATGPKVDPAVARDWSVADVVLNDLLVWRDSPLLPAEPGEPILLFSQEALAQEVTVARVLRRRNVEEWDKLSGEQLALAREAAEDLVRRLPKNDAYKRFASTDRRIRAVDKRQTEAATRVHYPDRPQLVRAYAPGYSRDQRLAVVRLDFDTARHGGVGTYILAKENGRWVVLLRDFRYFL